MRVSLTLHGAVDFAARRSGLLALALSLVLHACADPAGAPVTGPLATAERPGTTARNTGSPVDAGPLAAAHKANPADPAAALAYARALRAGGAKPEALA